MRRWDYFFFLLSLSFLSPAWANPNSRGVESLHPEVERVRGFQEYLAQKNKRNSDQEQGMKEHLDLLESQAKELERARLEYAKQKKKERLPEETASYRDHIIERQSLRAEDSTARQEYLLEKAEELRLLKGIGLNGMTELGLPENRPRYELEKRSLYGGKASFSRSKEADMPGRNFGRPSNQFSPPPPAPTEPMDTMEPPPFDDFPPPVFPEADSFDLPPPPQMDGGDDFFPPPPPPPEFDDGFNF